MKLLHVRGDDDYGALTFELSEFNKDLKKTWELARNSEDNILYVPDEEDCEFYIEAYEFDVSGSEVGHLLNFIQNEVMDYDATKSCNFYVVEEE